MTDKPRGTLVILTKQLHQTVFNSVSVDQLWQNLESVEWMKIHRQDKKKKKKKGLMLQAMVTGNAKDRKSDSECRRIWKMKELCAGITVTRKFAC